jgi:hypothetical protein
VLPRDHLRGREREARLLGDGMHGRLPRRDHGLQRRLSVSGRHLRDEAVVGAERVAVRICNLFVRWCAQFVRVSMPSSVTNTY